MSVFQCKMCGANLEVRNGNGIYTCNYCGLTQMVSTFNDGTISGVDNLLKRGFMALEEKEWDDAKDYFEDVFDKNVEEPQAYLGLLMCDLRISDVQDLQHIKTPLDNNKNYKKAVRFGMTELIKVNEKIRERLDTSYIESSNLEEQGELYKAALLAGESFKDEASRNQSMRIWENIRNYNRNVIACGLKYSVAVNAEGKVVLAGNVEKGYRKINISDWSGIMKVFSGTRHVVGLKYDGTVVASGDNEFGQCNVEEWWDIVEILCEDDYTIGLKADGKVVATGNNEYGQCNVSGWTDIVSVTRTVYQTVGLKKDGTVITTKLLVQFNSDNPVAVYDVASCVSGWTNIMAIYGGCGYVVGLKADGSIVSTSHAPTGMTQWSGITDVSTLREHIKALKDDGTTIDSTEGKFLKRFANEGKWDNIIKLYAFQSIVLGLRADGKLDVHGDNSQMVSEISKWKDIIDVAGLKTSKYEWGSFILGLRSDGTVLAAGENDAGQCNVSSWKNIGHMECLTRVGMVNYEKYLTEKANKRHSIHGKATNETIKVKQDNEEERNCFRQARSISDAIRKELQGNKKNNTFAALGNGMFAISAEKKQYLSKERSNNEVCRYELDFKNIFFKSTTEYSMNFNLLPYGIKILRKITDIFKEDGMEIEFYLTYSMHGKYPDQEESINRDLSFDGANETFVIKSKCSDFHSALNILYRVL